MKSKKPRPKPMPKRTPKPKPAPKPMSQPQPEPRIMGPLEMHDYVGFVFEELLRLEKDGNAREKKLALRIFKLAQFDLERQRFSRFMEKMM